MTKRSTEWLLPQYIHAHTHAASTVEVPQVMVGTPKTYLMSLLFLRYLDSSNSSCIQLCFRYIMEYYTPSESYEQEPDFYKALQIRLKQNWSSIYVPVSGQIIHFRLDPSNRIYFIKCLKYLKSKSKLTCEHAS